MKSKYTNQSKVLALAASAAAAVVAPAKSRQSPQILFDPIESSLSGSSVPGNLQDRTL